MGHVLKPTTLKQRRIEESDTMTVQLHRLRERSNSIRKSRYRIPQLLTSVTEYGVHWNCWIFKHRANKRLDIIPSESIWSSIREMFFDQFLVDRSRLIALNSKLIFHTGVLIASRGNFVCTKRLHSWSFTVRSNQIDSSHAIASAARFNKEPKKHTMQTTAERWSLKRARHNSSAVNGHLSN